MIGIQFGLGSLCVIWHSIGLCCHSIPMSRLRWRTSQMMKYLLTGQNSNLTSATNLAQKFQKVRSGPESQQLVCLATQRTCALGTTLRAPTPTEGCSRGPAASVAPFSLALSSVVLVMVVAGRKAGASFCARVPEAANTVSGNGGQVTPGQNFWLRRR